MSRLLTVSLAGFANPRYLSDGDQTIDTGFSISNDDAVGIMFLGASTRTVVHEQTLDPNGLTGWFPVKGIQVDSPLTSGSGLSSTGVGYIFPAIGIKARFKVTALSGADLQAWVHRIESFNFPPYLDSGAGSSIIPGSAAANAVAKTKSTVAVASLIAKASGGNLFGFTVKAIAGAAAQQVMLFNSATVPADGTVTPDDVFDVPAAGFLKIDYQVPLRLSSGITLALSSTGPYTKTLAVAANFAHISAQVA